MEINCFCFIIIKKNSNPIEKHYQDKTIATVNSLKNSKNKKNNVYVYN